MPLTKFKDIVYGTEKEFGLRELIFHQVCFLSLVSLSFGLLLTINVKLWDLVIVIVITQLVLTLSYWLSRVMGRFHLGWGLFVIISYALLAAIYFLNGGINGSTNIVSFLTLAILFATSQSRNHWLWMLFHAVLFAGLTLYELNYGRSLITPYATEEERYLDAIYSYFLAIAIFFLVFRLVRQAYEKQKAKVEEQRLALEQNKEDLEKSNLELIKVLSIIAHDVRNPLASIQSFLELSADDGLPKNDQQEINTSLQHMVQNTAHMLDDMVNWSKIQISGTTTSFAELSLSSWLNKTIDHLREIAKAKGVILKDQYNGRQKFYCDPILMTVIVRNLIQNAIKFTPAGKIVSLKVYTDKSEIVFEIEDQGMGIPKEDQANLFSGKAAIQKGTQNERGSGFGLMIVKEYVDAHQGKIELKSIEGEGSNFIVRLPLQKAH